MSHNLTELNSILFDALNDVKDGKMEKGKAQTIVNISNTIINNAKTQLDAFKLTQGKGFANGIFGITEEKRAELEQSDLYQQKLEFAYSEGHKTLVAAIGSYTSTQHFERAFFDWKKRNEKQ